MDPLGLAFENFDGIGGWRSFDGKFKVDASGSLPSGETFAGPEALKNVLAGKSDQFRRCLVEKVLTYALGRGLEKADRPAVDQIAKKVAADGDKFQTLVIAVAVSEPFRKQKSKREEAR
jgi:hypothetical protein